MDESQAPAASARVAVVIPAYKVTEHVLGVIAAALLLPFLLIWYLLHRRFDRRKDGEDLGPATPITDTP